MSSSGLVVPPASSAARLGKFTSKVPTLELDSSTWPEPSCRVPVQAVRAVRVGMSAPYRRRVVFRSYAVQLCAMHMLTGLRVAQGGLQPAQPVHQVRVAELAEHAVDLSRDA